MDKTTNKKILFVHTAYNFLKAQEILDLILMASTFNHEISILFLEDSVYLLNKNQSLAGIFLKNFSDGYKALQLYDIKQVLILENSLRQRNLKPEDLMITVNLISDEQCSDVMHAADIVINL